MKNALRFHYEFNGEVVYISNAEAAIRNALHLNAQYQFEEVNTITDQLGQTHIRWQIKHQHKTILGSVVIGHFQNNQLLSVNGILYTFTPSTPTLSKEQVINLAKKEIPSTQYAWDNPTFAQTLGHDLKPNPQLTYTPQNLNFANEFALCYKVRIYAIEPLSHQFVYINASNGEIWAVEDLIHETDVKGSANTKYRGVKPIVADSVSPHQFRLRETGRGGGIETYDMNRGTNYNNAVDFLDSNNYWDNYNAQLDEVAGDAHFGAEKTYDYFNNKFNRNSFDGSGAKIRSYIHYRPNYVNAFWNGFVMTYGDGNGSTYSPLTTVDICGHEIAHAVTTYSAGLIYRYESGALNESFSDIFGNAIEWFADSTQFSWRMGEDIMASKNGIRNMENPKTHRDPSTYKGQYWYSGSGDNGGVHTNSGVQNFWFYLLCHGKIGTNDNSDAYTVDSLGIYKAEQIAYRNLTVYLTNSSDYEEARYFGIQSAGDLYGYCSNEVEATTNAWYAVGVGTEYDSSAVKADFAADTAYCQGSDVVQFINKSQNAKSFLWTFGDGDTSTAIHPTHQYFKQGDFSVGLIVESCYQGIMDTIKRNAYISIDSTRDICSGILLPYGTWDTVRACSGYIYDHAGESHYTGLHRDTLTLEFAKSDSALLIFEEFDYETNYDSVYVYDGYQPDANTLIGGFTGPFIPNNGRPIAFYSGAMTFVHFSDPFVEGTGFKARFEAKRPALSFTHTPDTTVCHATEVNLKMKGFGGDVSDHYYAWNKSDFTSSIKFTADRDTVFNVVFGELCMREFLTDVIKVKVRDSIVFTQSKNPTICQGQTTSIWVQPNGGTGNYTFEYSNGGGLSNGPRADVNFPNLKPGSHPFWIAFSDQCTPGIDTAFFTITVRDSLQFELTDDTTICMGTYLNLLTFASGGDGNYTFTWEDASKGNVRVVSPRSNQRFTVSLSDGCSVHEPSDSVFVKVLDSLQISVSGPDLICHGANATLTAVISGGKVADREIIWENHPGQGLSWTLPLYESEEFKATLDDGCSAMAPRDSVVVSVRPKLNLIPSANQSICDYDTALISVTPSGGISSQHKITWSNGLPDGTSHKVSPSFSKSYVAKLTDGCSDSATTFITITVHDFLIPDFSVNATDFCLGEEVELTNTGTTGAGFSHEWQISNGLELLGSVVSFTPGKSGFIDVKLITTDNNGCSYSETQTEVIEIWDYPVANFLFNPDTIRHTDQVVQIENKTVLGDGFTWWVDGVEHGSEEHPLIEFNQTGFAHSTKFGEVMLVAQNAIGCSDTLVRLIHILGTSHVIQPTAFTPDNDGLNDTYGIIATNYKELEFWITNRHGLVIFESKHKDDRWDGTAKGKKVQPGLYNVFLRGTDIYGNAYEEVKTVLVVY